MEPLCGTLWNLNFQEQNLYVEPCGTSTFNRGTFTWNFVEPQLVRMEPVRGTSRNLPEPGPRFRAVAPNHPEAQTITPALTYLQTTHFWKHVCDLNLMPQAFDQIRVSRGAVFLIGAGAFSLGASSPSSVMMS